MGDVEEKVVSFELHGFSVVNFTFDDTAGEPNEDNITYRFDITVAANPESELLGLSLRVRVYWGPENEDYLVGSIKTFLAFRIGDFQSMIAVGAGKGVIRVPSELLLMFVDSIYQSTRGVLMALGAPHKVGKVPLPYMSREDLQVHFGIEPIENELD